MGYGAEWAVCNSAAFNVPQSRRRVYIICYLDPRCAGKILPVRNTNPAPLIQIVKGRQDSRVYDPAGLAKTLLSRSGGSGGKTGLYAVGLKRHVGITKELDTAYTLLASDFRGLNRRGTQNAVLHIKEATKRGFKEAVPGDSVNLSYPNQNQKRGRVGKGIANTLDTGSQQGVVTMTGRIRRLMPRECFRLQGFSEEQINRLLENSSDSQAYKQAGNAVTVNVVHAIALRLKAAHRANVAATGAKQEAA
jgi:DNA (cytosine-5)-methyltransferase 1